MHDGSPGDSHSIRGHHIGCGRGLDDGLIIGGVSAGCGGVGAGDAGEINAQRDRCEVLVGVEFVEHGECCPGVHRSPEYGREELLEHPVRGVRVPLVHPERVSGATGVEGVVGEGEVDGGGDAHAVEEGDGREEGQLEDVGHGGRVQLRLHRLVHAHRVVAGAVCPRPGDAQQNEEQ